MPALPPASASLQGVSADDRTGALDHNSFRLGPVTLLLEPQPVSAKRQPVVRYRREPWHLAQSLTAIPQQRKLW